jgi:hypothetical protein
MSVKITQDKVPDFLKAIETLTGKTVLVGIPEANAHRDPEPGEERAPASNAVIGYVQEFGAPELNIPARPFLVPGVEGVKDQIVERMRKGAAAVLDGDFKAADRTLEAVGLMAVDAVQQKLVDGPFVPLAPETLAAREAKGRRGTKPLLDTGAMHQAVTYVIRPKKKRNDDGG